MRPYTKSTIRVQREVAWLARRGGRVRDPSVEGMNLPVVAGVVSTVIFVLSMLPMLAKAVRTKDLESYSLGNMLLSNAGNLVHSVYVFSLPPGPIWAMHSFYLVATGTMLVWYLRYNHFRAPLPAEVTG